MQRPIKCDYRKEEDMEYKEEYKKWSTDLFFDDETRNELIKIKDDETEIEDRFYKELEFGTAGLRGIIGAGTNRMNKYTVTKATQGLANFIIKEGKQARGVVIAYDSRHMSKEFSDYAALTLNANGIKTYVFESLRPTPELSYAIRKLNTISGIVITASHNPPKYNGYKAYWEDGAQISNPVDEQIIEEVNKVKDYKDVKTMDIEEAKQKGLYNVVGKEIDDTYIEEIKKLVLNPEVIKKQKDLKIVYTPLHGTGNMLVKRVLSELGFENVSIVSEQELPDGDFPTVSYPNPEDPKAFELALNLAKKEDADVVLATDPDADRLGIYVKDTKTNEYIGFTGNMSCLLVAEYRLSQLKMRGLIPANGAMIKSIVSSNLAEAIVNGYNIKLDKVLTGFKNIGKKMKEYETTNEGKYLFGYEESYGCLIGDYARDKDGISAVMALCEAAAYYKDQGLTLWDQMNNIYEKYGYYKEGAVSITLEGIEGAEKIKQMMADLRQKKLEQIGDYKVLKIRDYKTGKILNLENMEESGTNLATSNVLYYELENDAWCCARPSGTEPKIKFYMGIKGTSHEDADKMLDNLKCAMKKVVE